MARPSSTTQQRNLSLTEELERLEQSITLTLQEIDQNFSIAHRIVTTSILPIVEQYATHSRSVWEGSKFWKQFFESSANVSLSGYEEGEQSSHRDSNAEETTTEEETETTTTHTTLSTEDQSYETPSQQHIHTDSIQDLDLSNLTNSPSHSTPRPSKRQQQPPQFADYPSPYEALRAEVNDTANLDTTSFSRQNPSTPGRGGIDHLEDIAHTPGSSPILPRQNQQLPPPMSAVRPSTTRKRSDPLLHRVLDKTYRIQATPLTTTRHRSNINDFKPTTTPGTTTRNPLLDSNLSSSPEVAPPELHAEIFSSPERRQRRHKSPSKHPPISPYPDSRTPGISVLTPARNKFAPDITTAGSGAAKSNAKTTHTPGIWDSDDEFNEDDDDDDEYIDQATGLPYGASPPKTIQFHIPQSRLLKTPAKEASRQIVNDVLTAAGVNRSTAGGEEDTEDFDSGLENFEIELDATDYDGLDGDVGDVEHSPTVVKRTAEFEDDTF